MRNISRKLNKLEDYLLNQPIKLINYYQWEGARIEICKIALIQVRKKKFWFFFSQSKNPPRFKVFCVSISHTLHVQSVFWARLKRSWNFFIQIYCKKLFLNKRIKRRKYTKKIIVLVLLCAVSCILRSIFHLYFNISYFAREYSFVKKQEENNKSNII